MSLRLVRALVIIFAVTLITYLLAHAAFHRAIPDCTPRLHDAPCEVSSFLTLLYTVACTSLAAVITSLFFAFGYFRRRAKARA